MMHLFQSRRVQLLSVVAVLCILLLLLRPLNYGIEFNGGVRIPISLEKAVDKATMDEIVENIKQSVNKFGISQAVVRSLGSSEILVEIPKGTDQDIKSIQKILNEQGTFEAILDGRQALLGTDVMPGSVGGPSREEVTAEGNWRLTFLVDHNGVERFTDAACGKGEYPIYMFLNRPENAAIVLNKSLIDELGGNALDVEKALVDALKKDGDSIELIFVDELSQSKDKLANKTKVIIAASSPLKADALLKVQLLGMGFGSNSKKIVEVSDNEMQFKLSSLTAGELVVGEWPAIGLFYAPPIARELGNCIQPASPGYVIQGNGQGNTPKEARESALKELKVVKSVLTGKRLPVQTSIGSSFIVAPSLGRQFLFYSWIAIFASVIAVSLVLLIRYRNWAIALPIIGISLIENFITTTAIGMVGTLDLAAIAGIVAVIGTGVNDQILITDELLKKRKQGESTPDGEKSAEREFKLKLSKAFEVIFAIAGVAAIAMIPLLVSNIVELTGFAFATILGILVGVFITRPAFGVIIKEIVK